MATLTVRNTTGAEVGKADVADTVFGVEPNLSAVRQTLLAYQANQRQGTHSTKTRAYVSGGGKKPFKQKGTGRARQGSIRAPQWRGGAIIFGPQPRDYRQKINKKVKSLALYSALSDLRNQNKIILVDDFKLSNPKTKDFISVLKSLGIADSRQVLLLTDGQEETVLLSARNLDNVVILPVSGINIYVLLTSDHVLATTATIKKLEEVLG